MGRTMLGWSRPAPDDSDCSFAISFFKTLATRVSFPELPIWKRFSKGQTGRARTFLRLSRAHSRSYTHLDTSLQPVLRKRETKKTEFQRTLVVGAHEDIDFVQEFVSHLAPAPQLTGIDLRFVSDS